MLAGSLEAAGLCSGPWSKVTGGLLGGGGPWGVRTYAAYDGVVAGQMGFAMLAAKDLV